MRTAVRDLSFHHEPLTTLFPRPTTAAEWQRYRLSDDQIRFFREKGFLTGVRMLNDEQVEALRNDLVRLLDPGSPRELFYEYHSNESADPDRVLFHALGAWRVSEAFHDLGIQLSWFPRRDCSAAGSASGTTNSSSSLRTKVDSSQGTRTTSARRAVNRSPTSPAGSVSTIPRSTTDACKTFPGATAGLTCRSQFWRES